MVNLPLLLDETGQPRAVKEISLNLFPDVTYVGVIDRSEREGDTLSWVGHLRGALPGEMTMVWTSGVFMGSFAASEGVYQASNIAEGVYRIVLIDRTQLPGGDESPEPLAPRH